MKLLVAIPSKARAEIFYKNAFQWLSLSTFDWHVFVEKEDMAAYLAFVPPERLHSLPESNAGLGYSKECIKSFAGENGYEAIFKVDDDIRGWTDFRKSLKPHETAVFLRKMIDELLQILKEKPLIAGFGFPYSFQMFEHFDYRKTRRVQTAYLFRTEDFHADRCISVFEDFAASLYAIVRGRLVLTCGKTGINMGVSVGGGTGGFQSQAVLRTQERAREACDAMRKLYPPLKIRRTPDKIWEIEPDMRSIRVGLYA